LSVPIRKLRPPARIKAATDFILRSYSRGVERSSLFLGCT
jgi:hypothetical protein